MKPLLIAFAAVAFSASPAAAQSQADDQRFRAAQERFDREYQVYREAVDRYQASRSGGPAYRDQGFSSGPYRRAPDPYVEGYEDDSPVYDPARDYRSGGQYRERVLSEEERVYA